MVPLPHRFATGEESLCVFLPRAEGMGEGDRVRLRAAKAHVVERADAHWPLKKSSAASLQALSPTPVM